MLLGRCGCRELYSGFGFCGLLPRAWEFLGRLSLAHTPPTFILYPRSLSHLSTTVTLLFISWGRD